MPRVTWDESRILKALKQFHRAGKDLSYNALARKMQPLVSAAAYHFGSYRNAVEKAGIDYAEISRRPRWTRQIIVRLIKDAHRKGEDLHWAAVTRRRDELGRGAFASLQSRLFGRWDKALAAAGIDAGEVSQYRKWDKAAVTQELRAMARKGQPLNSGAVQKANPGLHAAAVRHFGGYDQALQSAKLEPSKVRQRKRWDRDEVLKQLRLAVDGHGFSDSELRARHTALYSAAVRLFGSIATARAAAIKGKKK